MLIICLSILSSLVYLWLALLLVGYVSPGAEEQKLGALKLKGTLDVMWPMLRKNPWQKQNLNSDLLTSYPSSLEFFALCHEALLQACRYLINTWSCYGLSFPFCFLLNVYLALWQPGRVVLRRAVETDKLRCESWLCHSLAVWPLAMLSAPPSKYNLIITESLCCTPETNTTL